MAPSKFKEQTTRGTPDVIGRELRSLRARVHGFAAQKRALYDLANALVNVEERHEKQVVEVCVRESAVTALLGMVAAAEAEPTGAEGVNSIKVGRRELGMDASETKLYVLTCLVNLVYIGGGGLLHDNGGAGTNLLLDALVSAADGPETAAERFYAVAGLFNLSNSTAFAEAAARKSGLYRTLQQLTSSTDADVCKFAMGCVANWKAHSHGEWPPLEAEDLEQEPAAPPPPRTRNWADMSSSATS